MNDEQVVQDARLVKMELDSMGSQQEDLAGDHPRQSQEYVSDFRGQILRPTKCHTKKERTGISASEIISQVHVFQSLLQGCQCHTHCVLIFNADFWASFSALLSQSFWS